VADRVVPYLQLLAAQLRSQLQYRASLALHLLGSFLFGALDLVAMLVIFRATPALGGFAVHEVLLMTTMSLTAFALADLAVGNVERLPYYIRTGQLDAILVRPLGSLGQLLVMDLAPRRAGRLVQALALLGVSLSIVNISWTPVRVLLVVGTPLAGAVFFAALFIAAATLAFWWVESGEVGHIATYGGRDFVSYPMTVYGEWFRRIFAYGMGFAFISYYPVLTLLSRPDPLDGPSALGWCSPLAAAVAVGVATLLWRAGVRRYHSTGS
jgi:ABC-2 type transport system permease protein